MSLIGGPLPLTRELLAIEIAHQARRLARESARDLSVKIFSEEKNLPEKHVLDVINQKAEPSDELLAAIGWRRVIRQSEEYWPIRGLDDKQH